MSRANIAGCRWPIATLFTVVGNSTPIESCSRIALSRLGSITADPRQPDWLKARAIFFGCFIPVPLSLGRHFLFSFFACYNQPMVDDILVLKDDPTLRDFQDYVAVMVKERGFDKETLPEIFMLFLEECGELAKAVRKIEKIHSDKNSEQFKVENEAADVFMYLLDICNNLDIDLEKAFREKEALNKKRTWE